MPDSVSLNDDFFIKNAILCWLHYYPNHKWTGIYEELAQRDSYVTNGRRPRGRSKANSKPTDTES